MTLADYLNRPYTIQVRREEAADGVVRLPKSLHRELAEVARREGVSLNQWVNTVLSRAVGAHRA